MTQPFNPISFNIKTAPISLFALLVFSQFSIVESNTPAPDTVVIESFTPSKERKIPEGWRATRNDLSMFSFGKEGNNFFTTVHSIRNCTTIGKQYQFNTEKFPYLSWKWRVRSLPVNGSELKRDKNDSGAAIYVVFKGFFKLNPIIKYVWSSSVPVGTNTVSPFNKNTKVVILESGTPNINHWITETVNIYEDYKRLFGSNPPEVEAIGILTDSDNTRSEAIADYDDIMISKAPSAVSSK